MVHTAYLCECRMTQLCLVPVVLVTQVYGCDADDTLAAKVRIRNHNDSLHARACIFARLRSMNSRVPAYNFSSCVCCATQVWWGLMVHGHPQAMLLDGGFAEWTGAGRNEELYEPCCLKLSSETVYNAEPALQWVASPSSTQQQDSITIHVDMSQAREARLMALQVADSSRAENTTKDVLHAVLGGQGLQVDKRVVLSSSGDAGGSACVAAAALQHVGWSAWAVS